MLISDLKINKQYYVYQYNECSEGWGCSTPIKTKLISITDNTHSIVYKFDKAIEFIYKSNLSKKQLASANFAHIFTNKKDLFDYISKDLDN